MKISARNQIKGTVKTVKEGAVNAVAIIKATDVMVAVDWQFFRPRALREATREPQALVGWGSFAVRGLFACSSGIPIAYGRRAPRPACYRLVKLEL